MNEDAISTAIAEMSRSGAEIHPEVHYNHYGSRGVVDLLIKTRTTTGNPLLRIIEVKSDSAVQSATGANEIIRQFNRHREYCVRGSRFSRFSGELEYELAFAPTEICYQHIQNNSKLYEECMNPPKSRLFLYDPVEKCRGLPLLTDGKSGGWAGQEILAQFQDHIDDPLNTTSNSL